MSDSRICIRCYGAILLLDEDGCVEEGDAYGELGGYPIHDEIWRCIQVLQEAVLDPTCDAYKRAQEAGDFKEYKGAFCAPVCACGSGAHPRKCLGGRAMEYVRDLWMDIYRSFRTYPEDIVPVLAYILLWFVPLTLIVVSCCRFVSSW